ncbi:EF-hand calcium-binding domain-containing protein 1 [Cyphomyrmex costatus]|uniref:EF-hand calcium-binding domain-containing protein 1 n=1 Tax=Cyphomyrmex costatus TaxID=456900 RepID=A0A195D7F3_9HYME|nr:EF-hand calcium-binding domain-containing protein 1 [Cyphomyrmex costatus]
MSVLNFAQEFSRLINRYIRASSPNNDGTNTMTPLTEKQIVSTIHNVLLVLIKKDFDDKNNLFEMFNSASAVTTSEISVQQIKQEPKIQDIIRSQDAQHVQSDDDSSSFSDISLKDIKKERENSFNTLQNVKKCISQSNPAIYVTNISRSDTFIREENPKDTNDEDVFKNLTDAEMIGETDLSSDLCQVSFNERKSNLSSGFFHTSLKEIRKSVMDIMTKLNDLEQSFSQLTNSPREVTAKAKKSCLVNRHRSPDYVSVQTKTSINNHRSSSTSSKTSNSSKQLAKENTCISERRKSTGAIGKVTPVKKSNESTNVNNSVSSMDFSPYKPVESSEYRPKFTKNPKYAHVRSTIPKAISQKKKFQRCFGTARIEQIGEEPFKIHLEQWIEGLSTILRGNLNEKIHFAFNIYDFMHTNKLKKEQIFLSMRGCLIKLQTDEDPDEAVKDLIDSLLKKLDVDRDGVISEEEFHKAVKERNLLLLECMGPVFPSRVARRTFLSTFTDRLGRF